MLPARATTPPRGRGIGQRSLSCDCVCDRPHCHILCHVCGYVGWGRLRLLCPEHPQTIFLIDMVQCPRCHTFGMMMSEF